MDEQLANIESSAPGHARKRRGGRQAGVTLMPALVRLGMLAQARGVIPGVEEIQQTFGVSFCTAMRWQRLVDDAFRAQAGSA